MANTDQLDICSVGGYNYEPNLDKSLSNDGNSCHLEETESVNMKIESMGSFEDEEEVEEAEEIVMDSSNSSNNFLAVRMDDGTIDENVMEPGQLVVLDGDDQKLLDDSSDMQDHPPLHGMRGRSSQVQYRVISEDPNFTFGDDIGGYPKKIIDKSDPRSRLHFVKYIKKEGKTAKIFECGLCGKEFRHQYTLMRHLPTHTDERNFKCNACGKCFRQMSTLSQHRAIHSDARPYVCEVCKKTFNRVSTLISHRKTHSENKPHKCEICGRGFHQKGNLRNHEFTHTDERPYKCELCGKGFNQMSNLVCHKGHVHAEKPQYVCKICNKEFSRRYALRSHEEYKHGVRYKAGEGKVQVDPAEFQRIVSHKKRIKDQKNFRIIRLPNGDRTLTDMRELRMKRLLQPANHHMKTLSEKPSTSGVIIDPITTKAMKSARQTNQTPFALLKPAKGIPVLVKVMPAPNNKEMLVPATAEDLRSAGKITVSPTVNQVNNTVKAVQIKVPVVATVTQSIDEDGQLVITVESPGPENEQVQQTQSPDGEMYSLDDPSVVELSHSGNESDRSTLTTAHCSSSPDNLVASTINMLQERLLNDSTTDEDLLDLASHGEVQFVRTADDGSYEIMSQDEIAEVINDPAQIVSIEAYNDSTGNTSVVNDLSLTGLVDVIRSAGFEVTEEDKRIVICGGEEILEDSEQVVQDVLGGKDCSSKVIMDGQDPVHLVTVHADQPLDEEDIM
uniref:C2H2-type domain-containing protein n=1 Tax=Timema monikensis TaxID=170555 RepID=A0A7R9DWL6_9NEOP|nr:unnamed protein product [Timema monikensis]